MKQFLTVLSLLFLMQAKGQTFLAGRTTGLLPYLEYGQGDDRLGGAKMGYLDTNILIRVVDSFQTDYKVQLSQQHMAYLPKIHFKPDTSVRLSSNYLTSSWRVWGDDRYDYVTVSLPERLPYRSLQQTSPSRIVVDVFGAVSNTNWITQLKSAKEIRNAWYEQVEDDVFRIIIELKHRQHWGHLVSYEKNTLQVRIKRQPSRLRPGKMLVAIDAGHGGTNNGAAGTKSGILEKEYTLKIAQQAERYLNRKKFRTYMTRTTDTSLGMVERTLMLRDQDPDLLISIHLNSSGNAAVGGVSTYYRYIGFRPLSLYVLDRMLQLKLHNFGNIGGFNFSLSGPTEYPNCLVEVAFLSNEADEQLILQEKFHKDVAKKIGKGIRDWMRAVRKQKGN